ncbi:MAG TPA: hypothetical protein VNJ52_13560 [Patescibacteria group bacterium]|nr:hypothetical protein [Patescibacteria group bacterium]
MARGEAKVQQQAQQLGAQQQAMIARQMGAGQAAEPGISSGYSSLANWGSPQIENQYEQLAMQPVSTALDAASQQAASRVSRTHNAAGFGAEEENLAGQRASQLGQAAQRGQLAYQDTQLQNQKTGLQGLSSLYGIDTNLLGRMLGLPTQTLGVQAQAARQPGFWGSLSSSLGGALGKVGAGAAGALLP